jgi:hypothetical protein
MSHVEVLERMLSDRTVLLDDNTLGSDFYREELTEEAAALIARLSAPAAAPAPVDQYVDPDDVFLSQGADDVPCLQIPGRILARFIPGSWGRAYSLFSGNTAAPTSAATPTYAPSDCIDKCGNGEPCDTTRCPLPEQPEAAPGAVDALLAKVEPDPELFAEAFGRAPRRGTEDAYRQGVIDMRDAAIAALAQQPPASGSRGVDEGES